MRLTVIGCGDAFGAAGRLQTSFHVRLADRQFLIDCGASTLIGMRKLGLDPSDLSMVCITHLHGDHFGGLPWLLIDAQFVTKRKKPLIITGPKGTEARFLAVAEALYPDVTKNSRSFDLRFTEYDGEKPLKIDDLVIRPYEVLHPSGAPPYALRFEHDGKVIAFSGDTGWTNRLCDAARDADLFISECFQYDVTLPIHLDYKTIDSNYEKLNAKRLLLTHMGTEMLSQRHKVDGSRYLIAEDGMTLDL